MESNTALLENLSITFSELEAAIRRFNDVSFNSKPAGGNWSPAMVAQHLILAGTGIDKVLLGNTKPTATSPDEKVAQLKDIFLNFDHKMTSPEFIDPIDQHYSLEGQKDKLNDIGAGIIKIVPDLDLTLTCTDFEMPFLGYLTRLELISFVVYHTQRHTHQLKEMASTIA